MTFVCLNFFRSPWASENFPSAIFIQRTNSELSRFFFSTPGPRPSLTLTAFLPPQVPGCSAVFGSSWLAAVMFHVWSRSLCRPVYVSHIWLTFRPHALYITTPIRAVLMRRRRICLRFYRLSQSRSINPKCVCVCIYICVWLVGGVCVWQAGSRCISQS